MAVWESNVEAIVLLLNYGASIKVKDKYNNNVFDAAKEKAKGK